MYRDRSTQKLRCSKKVEYEAAGGDGSRRLYDVFPPKKKKNGSTPLLGEGEKAGEMKIKIKKGEREPFFLVFLSP